MRSRPRRPLTVSPPRPTELAVGTDLVRVADVRQSIEDFGMRYLKRVFTSSELAYCMKADPDPSPHLAARFAAKEATAKALRVGDDPIGWSSIEVLRYPDGSCDIRLHGFAHAMARRRGIRSFAVSLTHDVDYASAVVVAQRHGDSSPRLRRKLPFGSYER
jgi:holo-[acyl-carrier protein] synthase